MFEGYGYGNARLRAMRSRLLTELHYEELLASKDIATLITALSETPYKHDIEAALVRVGGINCVFEGLRTNLTGTLRKIVSFYQGSARVLVDILMRHWDRHNLLTILRGQSQEIAADTVLSALVPVGNLDEVSLREMARQSGLRAAIDLMTTWRLPYARALRQVQPRTGTTADLDQLELALNRFHYASLFKTLRQGNGNRAIVLDHLHGEVDFINIRTALRLARMPEITRLVQQRYNTSDIRPLLIEPDGQVPVARLVRLVAEAGGLQDIILALSDTRYGDALSAGWQRYQAGEGGFTKLERELERWQAEHSRTMFFRNPLSIAIPIGYLGCKELEIVNLRLIAQAVASNIDRQQIRPDLIVGEAH